jgi:hypothetical protein
MANYRIARQVAEWNPQGQRRRGKAVRGLGTARKDLECFGRDLWRIKLCLWVEESCVVTEKFVKKYFL